MPSLVCNSCCVVLPDATTHRDHYRTDWHAYNTKRRMAELQPVTEEGFKELRERIRGTEDVTDDTSSKQQAKGEPFELQNREQDKDEQARNE